MEEKYLKLGSVVLLKGRKTPMMIIGYLPIPTNEDIMYDYSAVKYPEGMLDTNKNHVFNIEDIEEVLFNGYSTEESETLINKIPEYKKEIENREEK